MEKTLAILEGDGIGPEIVREAVKVLKAVEQKYDHRFTLKYAPFGARAYFTEGSPFPEETRKICDEADVIVKGPVGLAVEEMKRIPPEHRPETGAILPLRKRYDTFANFRPVRLPANLAHFSPLRPQVIGDGIDILMIRELVGGIYFGNKIEGAATGMRYATDECTYAREQIRRVAVVAFEEAARRSCGLISIHKANILATSRFWQEVVDEISPDYPRVPYQSLLVDNAAYQLVKNPARLNGVVLLENMQGDILTDQAGGVIGSLGLMPSACIGPEKSYVEAAHGSAPDIAGKNIANPYSMIGCIALMFDRCLNLPREAEEIWQALFAVFEQGCITQDLAQDVHEQQKIVSTAAFGDLAAEHILKSA